MEGTYNKYTPEKIKSVLDKYNYTPIEPITNKHSSTTKILCKDSDGYIVYAKLSKLLSGNKPLRFHSSNNYSIDNINYYAKLNNYKSICISSTYKSMGEKLKFKCNCGNIFETKADTYIQSQKTQCDNCTGYTINKTYNNIKDDLMQYGYILITNESNYKGVTLTKLKCVDNYGYYYNVVYDSVMRGIKQRRFHKSNPYTIININNYLLSNKIKIHCISTKYNGNESVLEFVCDRCGEHIYNKWINIYRNDNNRSKLLCPNCDGRTESLHALVLKQMYIHYYPDTIVEERSCVNPLTGKIMPTDIVNHNLKIAVEIQSEWHDSKEQKIKDKIKKDYWINKGYKFYDPDIRDYSILEMCQIFFDIDELPNYINYNYSNKLNVKIAQKLLNEGYIVTEAAKIMNVSPHRIYDAIYSKKIYYPDNYKNRK